MARFESSAGLDEELRLLIEGEASSVELTRASLDRIEAAQPSLNAFRIVLADEALEAAARADERAARGGERPPLLGVPVAVKDDVDLAGWPTAFGCDGEFELAERDSELVRRLREAGAVIVGKTNTPEFGQWPITEGPCFGATRNPWSLEHTPGGSSGGTAAAVAAGLVAAGIGSDGAGSVRIPASWTNLVGIKPQRGRISTLPDVEPFNGLTCFGPLARTVADAAIVLDAVAGSGVDDRHHPPPPREPFARAAGAEPPRLRIALSFEPPFSGAPSQVDSEVQAAVERIATVLAGLGHEVVRAEPSYGLVGASFLPRATAGIAELTEAVADPALLDPRSRESARTGRLLRGAPLRFARRLESRLQRRIGRLFRDYDVLITPTTAKPPMAIGSLDGLSGWRTNRLLVAACPYSWAWNVLGWPGISVPAGFVGEPGLPVGAQLLGPACSEELLISLAGELEGVERWHEHRPRIDPAALAA